MRPNKARARYGTGDFLILNKRECGISIELIPCGADFLKVNWCIGGDNHTLWASSAMGYQFSSFVGAVYQLYSEGSDTHSHNRKSAGRRAEFTFPGGDPSLKEDEVRAKTRVLWDGEGHYYEITFDRKCKHWNYPAVDGDDLIEIKIEGVRGRVFNYTVDGRDLCYAAAKAYTDAIKKYGFYGYYMSTGGDCNGHGDIIDIHMILFIKAYALGAMDVRKLETAWRSDKSRWQGANRTSFDKEVELLLFEM